MSDLEVGVVVALVSMGGTLLALGIVGVITTILARVLPVPKPVAEPAAAPVAAAPQS